MPVGPSHSRASSGGGSGGGFGGGFGGPAPRPSRHHNEFGHRHVPHPRVPRPPRTYVFFGRPVVMSSGTRSGLGFAFLFFVIFAIIAVVMFINVNNKSKTIDVFEDDARFYEQMIERAEAGAEGYYLADATFDDRINLYYNEDNPRTGAYEYLSVDGIPYYYVVFEYYNEVTEQVLTGETYTEFSSSQFSGLGGTIEVAYTLADGSWAVINTSYELENNQDYLSAKSSLSSTRNIAIVITVIAVIVLAVLIFLVVRAFKRSKKEQEVQDAKNQAEITEAQAKAQVALETAENTNRVCAYCGAPVPDGEIRCPSCGSTEFTKK